VVIYVLYNTAVRVVSSVCLSVCLSVSLSLSLSLSLYIYIYIYIYIYFGLERPSTFCEALFGFLNLY
jgi:hypothetical protein